QMKRVESILQQREAVAREYHKRLARNSDLRLPLATIANGRISWFVYVVQLTSRFSQQQRDRIWAEMRAAGIGCGRYFAPIHWQPAYGSFSNSADLANTEQAATHSLALP